MNKKIPLSITIAITVIAMTLTFSVTMILAMQTFDKTVSSVKEKEIFYNKIAEVDKVVRANYYGEIDDTTLYDMMGAGYVAGLGDKNSKYYTAKAFTELLDINDGKLMGVGVEIIKDSTGYSRVIKVYAGSPAENAGIVKGGYITKIITDKGETDVKNISNDALKTLLQGEAGTTVSIVYKDIEGNETAHELMRKSFDVPSVNYQVLETGVGYIQINVFSTKTASEFDYALNQVISQGATCLVFDVRNNAGGDLKQAADIIDILCPAGVIASAEYKSGEVKTLYTSDTKEISLPMTVIVNGNTASAAELFAVSLRDYGKASLVGSKTFGKGTIQNLYRLSDGSAIDLTEAKLIPGKSESFDGVGITPQYLENLRPDQNPYELGVYDDPQIIRACSVALAQVKVPADAPPAEGGETEPVEEQPGE